MKLLLAIAAAAGLSGCAAYGPYYGATDASLGAGSPSFYPYGATQVYPSPYYGGSSITYGATIFAPPPALLPEHRHWRHRSGPGEGRRWEREDGHDGRARDQRDHSRWHR